MTDTTIVRRTVGFELRDAAQQGDGLTISGYATTFDQPYDVFDWGLGQISEQFQRGAFRDTIRDRKPKMQFNHGFDSAFGDVPIGVWTRIREDRTGLLMEGRINDNWLTEPIRQAIGDGQIEGMSIAFSVVKEEIDQSQTPVLRTITAADLFEAGPVTWPANEATSVSLRTRRMIDDLRDPEVRAELARILTMPSLDPGKTAETGEPPTVDDVTLDDAPEATRNAEHLLLALLRNNSRRRVDAATLLLEAFNG